MPYMLVSLYFKIFVVVSIPSLDDALVQLFFFRLVFVISLPSLSRLSLCRRLSSCLFLPMIHPTPCQQLTDLPSFFFFSSFLLFFLFLLVQRELLAFQQHAKTVGDHQLLTVEARSRWEAKYHRYDVLKRRLAELRTQLQSCEDAMAEANRDQPVSGPHASALSHNATLAAVFRLAPLAQPSTAVTRGVVPEGVHPFAVSLDYDSGCASSVGADEAEEGEDGESSPSVTLECK